MSLSTTLPSHSSQDFLRATAHKIKMMEIPVNSSSRGRQLAWSFLGRRPYGPTFKLQEELRLELRHGRGPEWLLLLEHDPVYTLGRNASAQDVIAPADWLRKEGIEVHESNRGGQVTYHGPGQLVGYPIIDLNPDRRDIGRYVRDLQETLILTLKDFGLEGLRKPGKDFIGVWVEDQKIASIGVHLSRWLTLHGFALNVSTQLDHFRGIVACGLPNVEMTSISRRLGRATALEEVARCYARRFAEVFDRNLEERTPPAPTP